MKTTRFAVMHSGKTTLLIVAVAILLLVTCSEPVAGVGTTVLELPPCETCTKPAPPRNYPPGKPYLKIPEWPAEKGDWG